MDLYKKAYIPLIIFILIYSFMSFGVAPDAALLARYNVSVREVHLLSLALVVPFSVIWFASVFGSVELMQYAELIRKNKDGMAFKYIALGLGILAFRFPIVIAINSVLNYFGRSNASLIPLTTISVNYLNVFSGVAGFYLISKGTEQLLDLGTKKPSSRGVLFCVILTLCIAAAYAYLAIGRPGYQTPMAPGIKATYYLPSWMIIATIVVPFIFAWYKGLTSAYSLYFYRKTVPGILYRRGLQLLSVGIYSIIIASISYQFLGAQSTRLNKLAIGPLFVVIYMLLVATAVGYVLVAKGAHKLKKIEEV